MSGSCVTSTTVMPVATSSWNSAMISTLVLRVEVAGRLVGQDDPRLADQRAGDGDPLLLAAGQLVRAVVHRDRPRPTALAAPSPARRRRSRPGTPA